MTVSAEIWNEIDILRKAIGTGMFLVFIYDIIRILRRLIPHGNSVIAVEDLLFWLASAIIIFSMLFHEADGYLRGFSIGGVVLGVLIYSRLVRRLVQKIVKTIEKGIKKR